MDNKPIQKQGSLTSRVAGSAVWMTANSLFSKLVNFVGQIVLAWLLLPEQFGLISLALTVINLGDVLNQFGLGDVIINRHKRLHLWATAAFSLSMLIGLIATVLMLGLAPVAGLIYGDATVGYLVAIMAIATPFQALGMVPLARLQAELRFKEIALLKGGGVALSMLIVIICAAAGMGAYSFAMGRVLSAPIIQTLIFKRAKLQFRPGLYRHRWRYLFGDSTLALMTSMLNRVIMQGDYVILGLLVTKVAVGQYFMAFMLSVQAIGLVANNLAMVLFPGLSSLASEPKRQITVFIRGSRIIAAVAIPLCFWQAAVADPLIRLVLNNKWYDVIPLVQVLSLGMAARAAGWMWHVSLKAQRRYAIGTQWSLFASVLFVVVVWIAAANYGVMGAALAVGCFYTLVNPIQMWIAIVRFPGGRLVALANIFLRPSAIALICFGSVWLADQQLVGPNHGLGWLGDLCRALGLTVIGAALYIAASLIANRSTTLDFIQQIRSLRDRRRTPN